MDISVIIPTHNPELGRLRRVLSALGEQSLGADRWEVLLVDNASSPTIELNTFARSTLPSLQRINAPTLGLSYARDRGIAHARGEVIVFVDDDNLLAADYLEQVVTLFRRLPKLGVAGGLISAEFSSEPALWMNEFFHLLALRDAGPQERIIEGLPAVAQSMKSAVHELPSWLPNGAGLAIRRHVAHAWSESATFKNPGSPASVITDRCGSTLSSGGDQDIVLSSLRGGWHVAYAPNLRLQHIIPAGRLKPAYLARLNRGIQRSWVRVLARHGLNPWKAISPMTVPLRQARAYVRSQAWKSAAHRIRWQGMCGRFEGQADLRRAHGITGYLV